VQQYGRLGLEEGKTLRAIAIEIGISSDTLWGWLHERESSGKQRANALPERAKEFRAAVAALGARVRTTPYPPEVRALALTHSKEREAEGASLREVASELGVGTDSLRRWQSGRRRRRAAVVRRVAMASRSTKPTPSESIVVHGPAGVRVEGMDVNAIASLFKELVS
jgi:transposase-like protein